MYICTRSKIKLGVFQVERGRILGLHLGNKHKWQRRDRLGGQAKELSGGAGQAIGAWGFCYRSVSVKKTKGRAWTRPWHPFEAKRAVKWGSFEVWSVGTFQQSFYCVSHISACLGEVGEGAKVFCLEKRSDLKTLARTATFLKISCQKISPLPWYSSYVGVFEIKLTGCWLRGWPVVKGPMHFAT